MSGAICFRIAAPAAQLDPLLGAVDSLGCLGVVEEGGVLVVYFAADVDPGSVRSLADGATGIQVEGPEPVPAADWQHAWRSGLEPREVAGLWIRPSWCESRGEPELVIDPKQAFGSGEHATTRLALALLLDALQPRDRVLDVGSGSGILGLAALRRGAGFAAGVEIELAASHNAAENAAHNALPLALCCGTLDAVDPNVSFDLVVANMLATRLMPLRARLSAHTGRVLVLSGYLAAEAATVLDSFRAEGFEVEREHREEQSGDLWCAARLAHRRARQSSRSAASVSSKS